MDQAVKKKSQIPKSEIGQIGKILTKQKSKEGVAFQKLAGVMLKGAINEPPNNIEIIVVRVRTIAKHCFTI